MSSSNWSEDFVTLTQTIVDSFQIISASAQFLIIISFGYFVFKKNTLSKMKGLLILLSLGYIVDVIQTFGWIMAYLYNYENEFWFNFMEISFKYAIFSINIWNAVISFNRCSTVLWPLKHSKIWSLKNIYIFFVPFILLIPFALVTHRIFDGRFSHQLRSYSEEALIYNRIFGIFMQASSIITSSTMLMMTSYVYVKHHKKNLETNQRWDVQMLIFSIYSSFFMLMFSTTFFLHFMLFESFPAISFIIQNFGFISYHLGHGGSVIVLLVISKTIRQKVFDFYTFGKYSRYHERVVTISSSTDSNRT